jgi:hypothetical protein
MDNKELITLLEKLEDAAYLRASMIRKGTLKSRDGLTSTYYRGQADAYELIRSKLLGIE